MLSSSRAVSGVEGSAAAVRERAGGRVTPGAVGTVALGAVAVVGADADVSGEGAAVFEEGDAVFGEGVAVFGEGEAVFGEGAAVFGDGAAVLGDGAAVLGVGAVLGEGAAVFGDGVAPGVERLGVVEGACCAFAALVAASNVTVASSPAAIKADLRWWLIGVASWASNTATAAIGMPRPAHGTRRTGQRRPRTRARPRLK